jgi:hypothetical protein
VNNNDNSTAVAWQESVASLKNVVDMDRKESTEQQRSTSDGRELHLQIFELNMNFYLQYVGALLELDSIYNEMTHPQKREFIKGTQTLIIKRIIELRYYFYRNPYLKSVSGSNIKLESWDYLDFHSDAIPSENKFKFFSMLTPIPQFIKDDCQSDKLARSHFVAQCLRRFQCNAENEGTANDPNENSIGADTCILDQTLTALDIGDLSKLEINAIQTNSAITIQRYTRGFLIRLQQKRNKEWIRIFIGLMENDADLNHRNLNEKRLENLGEEREYMKQRSSTEYIDSLFDLREEVRRNEGFSIKEDLFAKRIKWVSTKISETNQIPESLQDFYDVPLQTSETPNESKDNQNIPYVCGKLSSSLYEAFMDNISTFNLLWANEDVSAKNETFSPTLAKDLVAREQVIEEIRKTVDHELLTNLGRLKELDNDAKCKKNADKSKRSEVERKSKRKREKDLPGDKIPELKGIDSYEILERLARYNVIQITHVSMDEYICSDEFEICDNEGYPPLPSMLEAKRVSMCLLLIH